MFVLSKLEAEVRVVPQDLIKPPLTAVTEVLEQEYLDKVIPDLGLAVSIYDVLSVEGGHIYPNDGAAYFRVCFRLVVFRPLVGEVLAGKILSCSRKGIRVSVDFFEDIHVPDYALQEPSLFDPDEGVWKWTYEGQELFMDISEPVRLRVTGLKFTPPPPPAAAQAVKPGDEPLLGTSARPYSPMEVIGDMCGDGLGCISWWEAAADGAEEADAAE